MENEYFKQANITSNAYLKLRPGKTNSAAVIGLAILTLANAVLAIAQEIKNYNNEIGRFTNE